MGSSIDLTVVVDDDRLARRLCQYAVERLALLEWRWSRFLSASEVSRLGASQGQPVRVSADTRCLVRNAVAAWQFTSGVFDPTVLPAVRAIGYDISFEQVRRIERIRSTPVPAHGCGDVVVDDTNGCVTLPRGAEFDPGGIGKGLAADIIVEELRGLGADGVSLGVGGDVRVGGCGPESRGWVVRLAHPMGGDSELATVWLADGAVATSSTRRRRWSAGKEVVHHLIDPVLGDPTTLAEGASVIAGAGWIADALATAVTVSGSFIPVENLGAAAAMVSSRGEILYSSRFDEFAT
jgi:thiamine biosynthesis lipoprotein